VINPYIPAYVGVDLGHNFLITVAGTGAFSIDQYMEVQYSMLLGDNSGFKFGFA